MHFSYTVQYEVTKRCTKSFTIKRLIPFVANKTKMQVFKANWFHTHE